MGDDFVEDWIGINAPSGVGALQSHGCEIEKRDGSSLS